MNKEIIDKLDEITSIIKNDKELIEYHDLEEELLNDNELIEKIDNLKRMDKYNDDYLSLKKEILSNKKYKRYTELEKKIYFDIKDINNKLSCLKEKSGCN